MYKRPARQVNFAAIRKERRGHPDLREKKKKKKRNRKAKKRKVEREDAR